MVTHDRPDPPGQWVSMRVARPELELQLFRDRALDRLTATPARPDYRSGPACRSTRS